MESTPPPERDDVLVKAVANNDRIHNPSEEAYWVSRLRENFTSGSYGEGLETGRA
jgi:hypothetical protein